MRITHALAVVTAAAALAVPVAANAATVPAHHKHHAAACRVSDWGNTAQIHGKWYICQPAGRGYTWQALPGRQMAS